MRNTWLVLSTEVRAAFRELVFREDAVRSPAPLFGRLSPRLIVPAACLIAAGYVAWRAWNTPLAGGAFVALQQGVAWLVLGGVELLALVVGVIGGAVAMAGLRAETEHLLGLPVSRLQLCLARLVSMQVESAVLLGVLALPALLVLTAPAGYLVVRTLPFLLVGLTVVVTLGAAIGAGGRLAWFRLAAGPPMVTKVIAVLMLAVVTGSFLGLLASRPAVTDWGSWVFRFLPVSGLLRCALEGRLAVLGCGIVVLVVLTASTVLLGTAAMQAERAPQWLRVHSRSTRRVVLPDLASAGLFSVFLLKDALQYWRSGRAALTGTMVFIMVVMLLLGGADDPLRGEYLLWYVPLTIAGQYVLHAVGQEGTNLALVRMLFPTLRHLLAAKYASGLLFTAATGSLVYLCWQAVAVLIGSAIPNMRTTALGLAWLALLSMLATLQAMAFGTLYADLRVKRLAPHRGCSGFGELLYLVVSVSCVVVLDLLWHDGFRSRVLLLVAGVLLALTLATLAGASSHLRRIEGC